MKNIILGLAVLICVLVGTVSSEAVIKQVGAKGECDTTLPGCDPPPVVSTLCLNPSTCARITAVDPSNSNLVYGTDGTNCRKSTDGGTTWADCAANPSTVVLPHYAVAQDGEVLAAGNGPGGAAFIIQRSTDGGVSWSNVFSTATVDGAGATIFTQKIACASSTLICIGGYLSAGNQFIGLSSADGGATWSSTSVGTSIGTFVGTVISSDGTSGVAPIRSGDGTVNYKGGVWDGSAWALSATWPNTAGALCGNPLFYNGSQAVFCKETTAATYTIRDADGLVQTTITLPNGFTSTPGTYVGYAVNLTPGNTKPLVIVGRDSRVGTSVWITIDGSTFVQTNQLSDTGFSINVPGSAYIAHSCAYFSSFQGANTTGILLKVC